VKLILDVNAETDEASRPLSSLGGTAEVQDVFQRHGGRQRRDLGRSGNAVIDILVLESAAV
jgi:hypothetical protein